MPEQTKDNSTENEQAAQTDTAAILQKMSQSRQKSFFVPHKKIVILISVIIAIGLGILSGTVAKSQSRTTKTP